MTFRIRGWMGPRTMLHWDRHERLSRSARIVPGSCIAPRCVAVFKDYVACYEWDVRSRGNTTDYSYYLDGICPVF